MIDSIKYMPKLNFSGNLQDTITNNILELPVIPIGAFPIIQDGVEDGRQNINAPKILWQKVSQWFSILLYIWMTVKKSIKIWPPKNEWKLGHLQDGRNCP